MPPPTFRLLPDHCHWHHRSQLYKAALMLVLISLPFNVLGTVLPYWLEMDETAISLQSWVSLRDPALPKTHVSFGLWQLCAGSAATCYNVLAVNSDVGIGEWLIAVEILMVVSLLLHVLSFVCGVLQNFLPRRTVRRWVTPFWRRLAHGDCTYLEDVGFLAGFLGQASSIVFLLCTKEQISRGAHYSFSFAISFLATIFTVLATMALTKVHILALPRPPRAHALPREGGGEGGGSDPGDGSEREEGGGGRGGGPHSGPHGNGGRGQEADNEGPAERSRPRRGDHHPHHPHHHHHHHHPESSAQDPQHAFKPEGGDPPYAARARLEPARDLNGELSAAVNATTTVPRSASSRGLSSGVRFSSGTERVENSEAQPSDSALTEHREAAVDTTAARPDSENEARGCWVVGADGTRYYTYTQSSLSGRDTQSGPREPTPSFYANSSSSRRRRSSKSRSDDRGRKRKSSHKKPEPGGSALRQSPEMENAYDAISHTSPPVFSVPALPDFLASGNAGSAHARPESQSSTAADETSLGLGASRRAVRLSSAGRGADPTMHSGIEPWQAGTVSSRVMSYPPWTNYSPYSSQTPTTIDPLEQPTIFRSVVSVEGGHPVQPARNKDGGGDITLELREVNIRL